jgi:glycosyltransferase involved in cell wall biosynthesis
MKVLLVSSNSSSIGGGERYLAYLAQGLRRLGHDVHALVGAHDCMDPIAALLAASGAGVRREPIVALRQRKLRFISACLDRSQQRRLALIYEEMRPDVVHVNQQYDEDGLDLILAARRARLPVVGTIHLPMCRDKLLRPLGRFRTAWMKAWYKRVPYLKILVSADAAQEFADFYGCGGAVFQVDNATFQDGASEAAPAAPPPGWAGAGPIVGFAGQFEERKDPLLLFRAWLILRSALPGAKLLLVGDGPLRPEIGRAASAEGLADDLHITGWVSDVSPWLKLMDVYAFTSHFEGMPLALIEAACAGLRIVALPAPGVSEVLSHVKWAASVPSRDPRPLADALRVALASGPPCPDQVAGVREHFSVTRMARDVERVYRQAIRGIHERKPRPAAAER